MIAARLRPAPDRQKVLLVALFILGLPSCRQAAAPLSQARTDSGPFDAPQAKADAAPPLDTAGAHDTASSNDMPHAHDLASSMTDTPDALDTAHALDMDVADNGPSDLDAHARDVAPPMDLPRDIAPGEPSCEGDLTACPSAGSTACVSVRSNRDNCGACGRRCCGLCISGECRSEGPAGTLLCPPADGGCIGTVAIDPETDPVNCGECGRRCRAGEVCDRRACVPAER